MNAEIILRIPGQITPGRPEMRHTLGIVINNFHNGSVEVDTSRKGSPSSVPDNLDSIFR